MAGSSFGRFFKITTFGESHGKAIGVVVDGCPSGVSLDEEDIQSLLDRRKPGQSKYTTQRNEDDRVEILSGVFEGKTTGTPICMIVYNHDQHSQDYGNIVNLYRPGHADYTFDEKYGFRDYRGGGRSSGRETISRVAAGAIAKKILTELGIDVFAYTSSIKDICINKENFSRDEIYNNSLCIPDKEILQSAYALLDECIKNNDSAGGVIECIVKGVRAGIGDPVFDKLDANLAKAVFSIGSVKGFEIGLGFEATRRFGSENNDAFFSDEHKKVKKHTNNAGGILGGISDGSDITMRVAIKPTPSIYKKQATINKKKENDTISIKGRHDPIIVPRAVVVVESMVAITIVDEIFSNLSANMQRIKNAY